LWVGHDVFSHVGHAAKPALNPSSKLPAAEAIGTLKNVKVNTK